MSKSVLVIGLGRFGRYITKKFNELNDEVMAIDINEENNVFSIGKVINITGSMIEVAGLKDVAFFENFFKFFYFFLNFYKFQF